MKNPKPFFSIGITTYDRLKMLKETVVSILKQTYFNFEVIISNDNPQRIISAQTLGIKDKRLRFINKKKNLGEVKNMNFLLDASKGKYFTWLADDDLYNPDFLKIIYATITRFNNSKCIYTAYSAGNIYTTKRYKDFSDKIICIPGRIFLNKYLNQTYKTIGCYGLFDRQYLKSLDGIKKMGRGFGPYSDNVLALKTGLLDKVIFINLPLIFLRTHNKALSVISTDIEAYFSAQQEAMQIALQVFKTKKLSMDFNVNLYCLLRWFIRDFSRVAIRANGIKIQKLKQYSIFLLNHIKLIRNTRLFFKLLLNSINALLRAFQTILVNKIKFFYANLN